MLLHIELEISKLCLYESAQINIPEITSDCEIPKSTCELMFVYSISGTKGDNSV